MTWSGNLQSPSESHASSWLALIRVRGEVHSMIAIIHALAH